MATDEDKDGISIDGFTSFDQGPNDLLCDLSRVGDTIGIKLTKPSGESLHATMSRVNARRLAIGLMIACKDRLDGRGSLDNA